MYEQDSEKAEIFDAWNEKQKQLDTKKRRLLFKEGEIWWCSIGMNIGEEVYGKGIEFSRPVIILKRLTNNSCVVLPITSKPRSGNWYHHTLVNDKNRWVMMHQIRSISGNRFIKRDATLPEEDFIKLKKSVAELLGLS